LLQNVAKTGKRNMKKAIVYAQLYLDGNQDPPSGMNLKALVDQILDKMWDASQKAKKTGYEDNNEIPDDDDEENQGDKEDNEDVNPGI
jgi:hypothetical protein